MTTRQGNRRRTSVAIVAATLTLLLTSGCSAVLSNRVTAESVVGEWTAVDESPGSDALGATVTLTDDGVAVARGLPPRALDLGRSSGTVDLVGTWTIVRGSHPLDFAHVVLTGRVTTESRTLDASLELLIDSGPPTLLSVWLDKADFTRKLTFARTSPDERTLTPPVSPAPAASCARGGRTSHGCAAATPPG